VKTEVTTVALPIGSSAGYQADPDRGRRSRIHSTSNLPTDSGNRQCRRRDPAIHLQQRGEHDLWGCLQRCDIREVFVAQDSERLKDLMTENVISLHKDATMKQAAEVPYRDVMNLKHRILE
jgi:hypothetical protein